MILALDILKCIKYIWPTETHFQKSFYFSCQPEKYLWHSFNGAVWIILVPPLCSYLFLLVFFADITTKRRVLKPFRWVSRCGTHGHAGLWACPQLPLWLQQTEGSGILRTLFKSHLNPESPEICRLGLVPLSKEWLHWVSARLVSPSWASYLSSVRMWAVLFPVCKSTSLKSP